MVVRKDPLDGRGVRGGRGEEKKLRAALERKIYRLATPI